MEETKKQKMERVVTEIEKVIYFSASNNERISFENVLKRIGISNIKVFISGILFLDDGTEIEEGMVGPLRDKLDNIKLLEADGKSITVEGKLALKFMLLVFKALSKMTIKKATSQKFVDFIKQRKRITAAENYLNPAIVNIYNDFFDQILEIHYAQEEQFNIKPKSIDDLKL